MILQRFPNQQDKRTLLDSARITREGQLTQIRLDFLLTENTMSVNPQDMALQQNRFGSRDVMTNARLTTVTNPRMAAGVQYRQGEL